MSTGFDLAGMMGALTGPQGPARSWSHREPAIVPVTPSITAEALFNELETSQAWLKLPTSFSKNPVFERRLEKQSGNLDFTNPNDITRLRRELTAAALKEVSYLQETRKARLADATHHGMQEERIGIFNRLVAAYEVGMPTVEGSSKENRHELAKLLADHTLQNIKEAARSMLPKKPEPDGQANATPTR